MSFYEEMMSLERKWNLERRIEWLKNIEIDVKQTQPLRGLFTYEGSRLVFDNGLIYWKREIRVCMKCHCLYDPFT